MKWPIKPIHAWETFWFRDVPPYSLAAFRILFGLYLLIYFLSFAFHVELLFSNRGVYAPFLFPDIALPLPWAWALYLCMILTIVAFIAGFRTRWITPLMLGLYLYYFFLNLAAKNTSYDRLNLILLVIICFTRLDAAWSIGKLGKSQSNQTDLVSIWAIRLITIQISLLYFGAGLWKLIAPPWHTGEMLHWTMIGAWGTPLAFWLVRLNLPPLVFDVLTWGVIVFELAVSVALFIKKFQVPAIVVGILFHLSIAILLHIPEFMNCVCAYVLFVNPVTVQRWVNAAFLKTGQIFQRFSKS